MIGIQLGISCHTLDIFKKELYPLAAVINHSLKNIEAFFEDPFSWKPIVAALRSSDIGEIGLAESMAKKYCHEDNTESDSMLESEG